MSTHTWYCAWCGKPVACCNDEHVLGSGNTCCEYEYADNEPKPVEFCSLECFYALREQMDRRLEVARDLYPDWFTEITEVT